MKTHTLLAVDDRPENLFVLKQLIAEHLPECSLVTAESADEGLMLAAEQSFDGTLIDVQMPGIDGIEMCRRLKAGEAKGYLPVLLVTAHGSTTELRVRGLEAGADDFISRPVDNVELAAKIRVMLRIKRAEEALRESEERFRLAAETVIDLVYEWDITTDRLEWFGDVDGSLGFAPGEVPRTLAAWFDLIHPDDQPRLAESVKLHRESAEPIHEEYRIQRKDATWRYWVDCGGPLLDDNGHPRKWIGACVDVTQRKQAEEALRQSEEKFRVLAEESPNMIFINQNGKVVYANRMCERVMGYTCEEFYSPDFDFRCLIAPEYLEMIGSALGKRQRGENMEPFEYAVVTKDGARIEAILSTSLIAYGGSTAILGIITDITERKQAEEHLHRMQAQLAHVARVSTVGEMVAGIAHEISQPLCSIRNFAQASGNLLAAEEPVNLDDLREWHAAIDRAAAHAAEVVKRLRGFVRRTESQRSFCRINEIVNEALQLVAFEAGRHKTTVGLELCEASPIVHVDRVEIQQVLVNLLQNAYEAMDESKTEVREVTVRTEPSGELVEISVADAGPGLPSENDSQIFSAFVTTKPDGLGMGLAIATTIVEAHDGRLWVAANRDGGATFHFTLPVAREGAR